MIKCRGEQNFLHEGPHLKKFWNRGPLTDWKCKKGLLVLRCPIFSVKNRWRAKKRPHVRRCSIFHWHSKRSWKKRSSTWITVRVYISVSARGRIFAQPWFSGRRTEEAKALGFDVGLPVTSILRVGLNKTPQTLWSVAHALVEARRFCVVYALCRGDEPHYSLRPNTAIVTKIWLDLFNLLSTLVMVSRVGSIILWNLSNLITNSNWICISPQNIQEIFCWNRTEQKNKTNARYGTLWR